MAQVDIGDLEPASLAKYLQVAAAQRKRAAVKFIADYGPTSNVVAEVQAEIASLDMTINSLLKQAAASPRIQKQK